MPAYELILGLILIMISTISIMYHEHSHLVKEQRYLKEQREVEEDKQFAMAMYHEIRKVVCTVAQMEQLLPISKRSFINITYPCPISM